MPEQQDDLLLAFLRGRNVRCPVCKYNLRDATQSKCPECGKRLSLSVSVTDLSVQAWALLTFVTCLVAGPGILMIAYLIFFMHDIPSDLPAWSYLVMGFFALSVPTAVLLLVFRNRFLRLPRHTQHVICAIGCIVWLGGTVATILAGL